MQGTTHADKGCVTAKSWRDVIPVHPAADLFPHRAGHNSRLRDLSLSSYVTILPQGYVTGGITQCR